MSEHTPLEEDDYDIFLEKYENILSLYDSQFTKKDAKHTGEELIRNELKKGNTSKHELMGNLVRLQEVIITAVTTLREELPFEAVELNGVKYTPHDGGYTLNYEEDSVYVTMKADLDARVEQLKLAQKQDTFDAYGNQVPKVSKTPRKSSISISF